MRIKIKFIIIIAFFLAIGCAGQHPAARVSGPYVTYTHESFIQKESGETGLYIDGEPWYALIDLKDLEDVNDKFVSPYQFMFQKNDSGIILTVFAEKIEGINDSRSCSDRFASNSTLEKLGNKTVLIKKSDFTTTIRYNPYYEGYCFDFHFSAHNQESIDKVAEIVDSVNFIDGAFSNVFIKKLIYQGDKRIQLLIPDNLNISYESGSSRSMPSIVLTPGNGDRYKVHVTLLVNKDDLPIPKKQVRGAALRRMKDAAMYAVDEPKLLEITKKDTTIYYYVAEDKNHDPSNKADYPFICQGYAAVEDSVLYFTFFYYETEHEITKQMLDMILNARVLKL